MKARLTIKLRCTKKNTNIEQDIDKIVKEYLEHEHQTFADLKPEESSITLVTLFSELKADTLVQQQLEIYFVCSI